MADVGYGDYRAAAMRLLDNAQQQTDENPVDRQIFEQGDPVHGDRLSRELDPNSDQNFAGRRVTNALAIAPNAASAAVNAVADLGERSGLFTKQETAGPDAQAGRLPTDWGPAIRRGFASIGIPTAELPENASTAQKLGEGAIDMGVSALPAAGLAAVRAAPGAWNAARAGMSSMLKNASAVPLAAGGAYAGDKLIGGDAGPFIGGTVGGMLPSTVLSPSATRAAQDYSAASQAHRLQQLPPQKAVSAWLRASAGLLHLRVSSSKTKSRHRRNWQLAIAARRRRLRKSAMRCGRDVRHFRPRHQKPHLMSLPRRTRAPQLQHSRRIPGRCRARAAPPRNCC